jgi:2'-5' RNA ligase
MSSLYFIAVIPPDPIKSTIEKIKLEFSQKYTAVHALKSPPHITLKPPFSMYKNELGDICKTLDAVASQETSFEITAFRFNAFSPKVIYIDFRKSHSLDALQKRLTKMSDNLKKHRFTPHMTIAFRDLSAALFYKAWKEYENKEIGFSFKVDRLYLLKHVGKKWQIQREFQFAN